jgi:hypothetical protein
MEELSAIVGRFSSSLYWLYGQAQGELGNDSPPWWLKTYLAFCALESVRNLLGTPAQQVYCRFSLGDRGPKDMKELDDFISLKRLYNPNVQGRPTTLMEHVVDFSASQASLLQAQGLQALDGGVRYKMLLAAESELVPDLKNVLEDCLKLVDVTAPLKVLLYPSNRQEAAKNRRKNAIQQLFNNCESDSLLVGTQWLFLAIPLFQDWVREDGDIQGLCRYVYTLEPAPAGQEGIRYVVQPRQWWNDAPALIV